MKPPNLQELVEKHGGYDKVPPEAWRDYQHALAAYQRKVRGPPPPDKGHLKATGK